MSRPIQSWLSRAARHGGWLSHLALSLGLALIGWTAVQWRERLWPRHGDEPIDWQEMGMDWLQRTSFDVPFVVRHSLPGALRGIAGSARPTSEAVILYMDEESARHLEQAPDDKWSRKLHARLLDRLTADGARAVLFDVVFDTESPEDAEFAAALTRNGRAFLGATFSTNTEAPLSAGLAQRASQVGLASEQLTRRNKVLHQAARGWGLLIFRPLESDYGVTRLFVGKPRSGLPPWPSATWQVAQTLGAGLPEDDESRFARRWINYYGPARRIESISYYRVLLGEGGAPPGYFKDKIVLVGAHSQLSTGTKKLLDEFSTPWSRLRGRVYMPGTEIHATMLLNLLHRDWLERVPTGVEKVFVVLLGLVLGGLRWLRPRRLLAVAVASGGTLFTASCLLQWHGLLWWNWAVPVLIQLPLGVLLAVASRYYLEERRRRTLRNAFGLYLSPDLADQIADQDFNLAPGGKKIEATLVFTDLEGFTTLSERLGDSAQLGRVLTDYFTRTTDQILAEKGTVVKFIGDAVFAVWNAPLPQPDHAERAVRASWRLAQASAMDVSVTRPDGTTERVNVRTRIGIHTGEALAGNLGSARRFDYTLIGDAVNFAARLEGANKYTGTSILLSEDTQRQVEGKFLVRRLGAFKVKGKTKAVSIYELLGEDPTARPDWLPMFDAALKAWNAGDLEQAAATFQAVKQSRGGEDGPSQFYLDRIKTFHEGRLQAMTLAPIWNAEVELDAK